MHPAHPLHLILPAFTTAPADLTYVRKGVERIRAKGFRLELVPPDAISVEPGQMSKEQIKWVEENAAGVVRVLRETRGADEER